MVTGSDMRGQDQSAPSDPIKTDAGPSLILTKICPTDSQPCQPTTPPSSPRLGPPSPPPNTPPPPHYSHPPPSLSDFAITPCDKQRPRLAHKAGVLCIMLTIKDSISSLILFTSPAVARPASASINIAGRGWVTQMRTCICWSKESRITAKSVYEQSRKTKQIQNISKHGVRFVAGAEGAPHPNGAQCHPQPTRTD